MQSEQHDQERALLSQMLKADDSTAKQLAMEANTEDFVEPVHQHIHAAILGLIRQGLPRSVLEIAQQWANNGTPGSESDLHALVSIASSSPVPSSSEVKTLPQITRKPSCTAVMRRMSDVEPKALRWLWPGKIPLGKLSLIGGDPGLGKSILTLDMAARISQGRAWPCSQAAGASTELGRYIRCSCGHGHAFEQGQRHECRLPDYG